MNSSQIAKLVLVALFGVAALLVSSAQWRVVQQPTPRRRAYVVAGAVSTILLAGLVSATDYMVGRRGTFVMNLAMAAVVCALALGVGEWWTRRPRWAASGRVYKFMTLISLHLLTVAMLLYVLA